VKGEVTWSGIMPGTREKKNLLPDEIKGKNGKGESDHHMSNLIAKRKIRQGGAGERDKAKGTRKIAGGGGGGGGGATGGTEFFTVSKLRS